LSIISPDEKVTWLTKPPRQIFPWAGFGRGGGAAERDANAILIKHIPIGDIAQQFTAFHQLQKTFSPNFPFDPAHLIPIPPLLVEETVDPANLRPDGGDYTLVKAPLGEPGFILQNYIRNYIPTENRIVSWTKPEQILASLLIQSQYGKISSGPFDDPSTVWGDDWDAAYDLNTDPTLPIPDNTGNNHNGIGIGTVTLEDGTLGKTIRTNGSLSKSQISFPTAPPILNNVPFSFLWVGKLKTFSSSSGDQIIFRHRHSNILVMIDGSIHWRNQTPAAPPMASAPGLVSLNTLIVIAYTWEGPGTNQAKIYFNGDIVAQGTFASPFDSTGNPELAIGAQQDPFNTNNSDLQSELFLWSAQTAFSSEYINLISKSVLDLVNPESFFRFIRPVKRDQKIYMADVKGARALARPGNFNPLSLGPLLESWINPNDELTITKDAFNRIAKIIDKSPKGNDLTQTIQADKPLWVSSIAKGNAVMRFNGINTFLRGPSLAGALTEAEFFIVVKIVNDPPLTGPSSGSWHYGTDSFTNRYPGEIGIAQEGKIMEGWGSTVRRNDIEPGIDLSTQFRIYHIITTPTEYTINLDDVEIFTSATNTVAFSNDILIGAGTPVEAAFVPYLDGDIVEIVTVNEKLIEEDREKLLNYLRQKNIFDPSQINSLHTWLDPNDESTITLGPGQKIEAIADKSGNEHTYTETVEIFQPLLIVNVAKSNDVMRFAISTLKTSLPAGELTAAELWVVIKNEDDPPTQILFSGSWTYGTNPLASHLPFTDGKIYEGWGSDTRTTGIEPGIDLSADFFVYNVITTPTEFTIKINGVQIFTRATNTVAFIENPILGQSIAGAVLTDLDIAEFVIFDKKLTSEESAKMLNYLTEKFVG